MKDFIFGLLAMFIAMTILISTKFVSIDSIKKTGQIKIDGVVYRIMRCI